MTDRRTYFFLAAALLAAAVHTVIPDQFRWVSATVTIIYLVFAALFAAASVSADRTARRNDPS